jgi:hypothetical protein
MPVPEMIQVENINTPGKTATVNAEKYHAMRKAMLKALPKKPPGLTFDEMIKAVLPLLPEALWPQGQKAGWWVKTVQLDLEAKGLIARDRKSKPLRWHRV